MSRYYLHDQIVLLCAHGGRVKLKPHAGRTKTAGRDNLPIIAVEDLEGATVENCPLSPPLKKCTTVLCVVAGRGVEFKMDKDKKTPLTSDLSFLTDGVPPGLGRPAGGKCDVVVGGRAVNIVPATDARETASAASAPPPKGVRVLRLKFAPDAGLPADWLPPEVLVRVVQTKPAERVWAGWVKLPAGGGEVSVPTDLPADGEAWAVVTSDPLDNALEQVEVDGVPPRLVAADSDAIPLLKEAKDGTVGKYEQLGGAPARVAALANGLVPKEKEKPLPPSGGALRVPVKVADAPLVLKVCYPKLVGLVAASSEVELDAPRRMLRHSTHPLGERVALAHLCAELYDAAPKKFWDTFATVHHLLHLPGQQPPGQLPLYRRFLAHHAKRSVELRTRLLTRFAAIRKAFDGVVDEYAAFVAASPFFLGTRDPLAARPNTPDALVELYLTRTAENPAVEAVHTALVRADECLTLAAELDAEPDADAHKWLADAVDEWCVSDLPDAPQSAGVGTISPGPKAKSTAKKGVTNGRGWKLLKWVLNTLGKHGQAAVSDPAKLQKRVRDTAALTAKWLPLLKPGTRAVERVLAAFGVQFEVAGGTKKLFDKVEKFDQLIGGTNPDGLSKGAVREIGAARLQTLRVLFGGVLLLQAMTLIEKATARAKVREPAFEWWLRAARTTKGVIDTVKSLADLTVLRAEAKVLATKGKLKGTARPLVAKIASRKAALAVAKKALDVAGYALDFAEMGRDWYNGDTTRVAFRALPYMAMLIGGTPAKIGVGLVVEWYLAGGEKNEDELELDQLLRKTEFGAKGAGYRADRVLAAEGTRVKRDVIAEWYANGPLPGTATYGDVRGLMARTPWGVRPTDGGVVATYTALNLFAAPAAARYAGLTVRVELQADQTEGFTAVVSVGNESAAGLVREYEYADIAHRRACPLDPPPLVAWADADGNVVFGPSEAVLAGPPVRVVGVPLAVGAKLNLVIGPDLTRPAVPPVFGPMPLAELIILDPLTGAEVTRRQAPPRGSARLVREAGGVTVVEVNPPDPALLPQPGEQPLGDFGL